MIHNIKIIHDFENFMTFKIFIFLMNCIAVSTFNLYIIKEIFQSKVVAAQVVIHNTVMFCIHAHFMSTPSIYFFYRNTHLNFIENPTLHQRLHIA